MRRDHLGMVHQRLGDQGVEEDEDGEWQEEEHGDGEDEEEGGQESLHLAEAHRYCGTIVIGL